MSACKHPHFTTAPSNHCWMADMYLIQFVADKIRYQIVLALKEADYAACLLYIVDFLQVMCLSNYAICELPCLSSLSNLPHCSNPHANFDDAVHVRRDSGVLHLHTSNTIPVMHKGAYGRPKLAKTSTPSLQAHTCLPHTTTGQTSG